MGFCVSAFLNHLLHGERAALPLALKHYIGRAVRIKLEHARSAPLYIGRITEQGRILPEGNGYLLPEQIRRIEVDVPHHHSLMPRGVFNLPFNGTAEDRANCLGSRVIHPVTHGVELVEALLEFYGSTDELAQTIFPDAPPIGTAIVFVGDSRPVPVFAPAKHQVPIWETAPAISSQAANV